MKHVGQAIIKESSTEHQAAHDENENSDDSVLDQSIRTDHDIVYLLRKVCTRVHALPYLQFESLLPHIKLSGCKIDVYYSPVMH